MGDGSSFGMLQAVETATPPAGADKVWFIDVIGDKSDPSIDPNGVLLSSVLWNFAGAFEEAIAQIDAGTFGTSVYTLDVANGGISLLQTAQHHARRRGQPSQAALAGISDGSITVPVTATAGRGRRRSCPSSPSTTGGHARLSVSVSCTCLIQDRLRRSHRPRGRPSPRSSSSISPRRSRA